MTSGGVCTGFVFAAHCFQTFSVFFFFFFFNDTATTEIYTLSLHDALPIWLPTPNRDLYGFVALAPQVSTATGLSGGGVNHRFNNFLIDGASELGVYGRLNGAVSGAKAISIEAMKENQIVLSPYAVSLGDCAGTLINAVTKSGTNDLHGTAFFYARSDQL